MANDRIGKIQEKLHQMFSDLSENQLRQIEAILDTAQKSAVSLDYLMAKVASADWPRADDPVKICGRNEDDKKARASAIYNLFIDARISTKSCKMLDYGCGEGHVAKMAADQGISQVVGYDISEQRWNRHGRNNNLTFTTDREQVSSLGPYDVILLYDVVDHSMEVDPVDVLKDAKSLLARNGIVVMRCHPWSSRHGTHLWSLNKAYAHLMLSEEQLAEMGHSGIPTRKIVHPRTYYPKMIAQAGMRITWEYTVYEQSGPIFEHNPPLKEKLLMHFDSFGYHDIEETFKDYVLKVI